MKWRYKIIVSVRGAEIVLAFFSVIHIASYFFGLVRDAWCVCSISGVYFWLKWCLVEVRGSGWAAAADGR